MLLRINNYKFSQWQKQKCALSGSNMHTMLASKCIHLFCDNIKQTMLPVGINSFYILGLVSIVFKTLNFFTFWQFDQKPLSICVWVYLQIYIVYVYYNVYDDMSSMFTVSHQLDNIANAILTILTLYYRTFGTPDWVH